MRVLKNQLEYLSVVSSNRKEFSIEVSLRADMIENAVETPLFLKARIVSGLNVPGGRIDWSNLINKRLSICSNRNS